MLTDTTSPHLVGSNRYLSISCIHAVGSWRDILALNRGMGDH
jgi:hypothetical protein